MERGSRKRKRSSGLEPEDVEQTNAPQSGDVEIVVENKSYFEHSAVLAVSPVFAAMLRNDMVEGSTKKINLDRCEKEYRVFRSFLQPVTGRNASIVERNVDFLLEWFHYYQIAPLVHECEAFLLTQSVSIDRLIQAKTFDLKKQYKRCLTMVAKRFASMPRVEALADDADLMRELLPLAQKALNKQKATVLKVFDKAMNDSDDEDQDDDPILKTVPHVVTCPHKPLMSFADNKVQDGLLICKKAVDKILV